jgi:septal ring factor EnvC (AmiA/AmiB activator)
MAILDNLTKAAKDFFVEPDGEAPARPAVAPAPAVPVAPAQPLASLPAGATQPEQRHLDHIAQLLTGDGRDFGAFTKMVKSLAASGLSGPLLYQTAFNAFAAVTGTDLASLLTSADDLTQKLADDRAKVQARHREKMGESVPLQGPPSALAKLREQEAQLQQAVASLSQQLNAKSQQLQETQQQLQQEGAKTQAALASYELAHAAATAELQAHQQATKSFLLK